MKKTESEVSEVLNYGLINSIIYSVLYLFAIIGIPLILKFIDYTQYFDLRMIFFSISAMAFVLFPLGFIAIVTAYKKLKAGEKWIEIKEE